MKAILTPIGSTINLAQVALVLVAVTGCGPDARPTEEQLDCPTNQTKCEGRCVDTAVDPAHCGECALSCSGGEICEEGACTPTCAEGLEACDGGCRDTQSDNLHCGGCSTPGTLDRACPDGTRCDEGECALTCPAELEACSEERCHDTSSDPAHCGTCSTPGTTDHACPAGGACVEGRCAVPLEDECLQSGTCACVAGYTREGDTCVDVDECATNNGSCDVNATCANTPGSRLCSCLPGWEGNGVQCSDVNECATNNGGCHVDGVCTNTSGSRLCACGTGWTGDGINCVDVNECATDNGGCGPRTTCVNAPGSHACSPLLSFDGVNDFAQTAEVGAAVRALQSATVEFWFRSNGNGTGQQWLWELGGAAHDVGNMAIDINDGAGARKLWVHIDARDNGRGGTLNQWAFPLATGFNEAEWHHYALVMGDGQIPRVFVDGVQLSGPSGACSNGCVIADPFIPATGSMTMAIGKFRRDNIRFVKGIYDDLRVSSVARYSTTFEPPVSLNTDADTVLLYRFEEGTGTSIQDLSGNGHALALHGATWVTK